MCTPVYRIHVTVGVENVQISFTDHITWSQSSQGYPKFSQQISEFCSLLPVCGVTSSGLEDSQWSKTWENQQRSRERPRELTAKQET